ncbi:hypothetical protein BJ508DRAFT_414073 [Ascobolus immersus RN42]|uniref:Uncharacterized protein n=1 Tax=Ascobolus immersus RN42 TaxID=1160509 RepID=A0A3N4IB08_ASCIM|nr:hypothetical protein BJ508DRAFT_414073 [Ascobolus immersus RN42]
MYPAGNGTFPTAATSAHHPSPSHHHHSPHHTHSEHAQHHSSTHHHHREHPQHQHHPQRQHHSSSHLDPPPVGTPPPAAYNNHGFNHLNGTHTPTTPTLASNTLLNLFPPLPPPPPGNSNSTLAQFSLSSPKRNHNQDAATRQSPTPSYLSSTTTIELYRSQVLNTNTQDLLAEVRSQHDGIKTLYERLKQTVETLPDLDHLTRDLEAGKRELVKARGDLETGLREWRGDRGAVFKEGLGRLEGQVRGLQAQVDGFGQRCVAVEFDKEALRNTENGLRDARVRLDAVAKNRDILSKGLQIVEKGLNDVKDQSEELRKEVDGVKRDGKKLSGGLDGLALEVKTLREANVGLKTEVSKVKEENKCLLDTISRLTKRNESLSKEMEGFRAEMKAIRQERVDDRRERDRLFKRTNELESVWNGVESNLLSFSRMVQGIEASMQMQAGIELLDDKASPFNATKSHAPKQITPSAHNSHPVVNGHSRSDIEQLKSTKEPSTGSDAGQLKPEEKQEVDSKSTAGDKSSPGRTSQFKLSKDGSIGQDQASIKNFFSRQPGQSSNKTDTHPLSLKEVTTKDEDGRETEGETIVVETATNAQGVGKNAGSRSLSNKRPRESELPQTSPPNKRPARHLITTSQSTSPNTTMEVVIESPHDGSQRCPVSLGDPRQQNTPPQSVDIKEESQTAAPPPPTPPPRKAAAGKRQLIRTDEQHSPEKNEDSDEDMVVVSSRKVEKKGQKPKAEVKRRPSVPMSDKRASLRPRKK